MRGSRKFRQGVLFFFSYQRISQRAVRTSLKKQLDPRGPIATQGGAVPVFLRKPIATLLSRGSGPPIRACLCAELIRGIRMNLPKALVQIIPLKIKYKKFFSIFKTILCNKLLLSLSFHASS